MRKFLTIRPLVPPLAMPLAALPLAARHWAAWAVLAAVLATVLAATPCHAVAQRRQTVQMAPRPMPQRNQEPERRTGPGIANNAARGPKGDHLAEWMNQHSNLTPSQQQQALEREPGFHDFPSQTQQRLRDRLAQLNAMPPAQRQRLLDHTEAMEHLTPDQRAQVRGAMQQLGALPPDQRRQVARSFRDLRDLPPDQRMAALNSRYGAQLNDAQRSTLNNLLRIEPMLPPPDAPARP